MKYSALFPDMKITIHDERDGIIRQEDKIACCICEELTDYIDLAFEAPFCSEECTKKLLERVNASSTRR